MNRNQKLSEHFTLGEFVRPGVTISPTIYANLITLCQRLEEARKKLGKPMVITSGYRTPSHNKAVGGAPKSYHLKGMAADFTVPGMSPQEVQKALEWWQGGMEYAPTWTHLDTGPKRRFKP